MSKQTFFPPLQLAAWRHTRDTVNSYAKVVGKVRRAMSPHQKHWWHVSLHVTATGLTTAPITADGFVFEVILDFVTHQLRIVTSRGEVREFALQGQSVNTFCLQLLDRLGTLSITADIDHALFADETPGTYDPTAVGWMWQAFTQIDSVLKEFKAGLRGETSPVQLWPHHFDLAMLWLSGRLVPGQELASEEYADEQMNFGFSTGDDSITDAYFYVTAYPTPDDFGQRPLSEDALWHTQGFTAAVLMYQELLTSKNPRKKLLKFLRAAHEAGSWSML